MTARPHENLIGRLTINLNRLKADMEAVNALGKFDGVPGVNRVSFSDADMAGRRWLMERMKDAGLEPRMDAAGNVFGRWTPPDGNGRPAVLAGSHLDTVPHGGAYDGTLGVCAALEAVRAMREAGLEPLRAIEVVCTADEEGRFGGMFGSQAICGEVGSDWIEEAVDDAGIRLADAMREQGLDPAAVAPRNLSEIAVFLELHVEQGPVLEREGLSIGVVNAVSGVFNWTVTLTGEANHSGTTPMDMRRDAFRGLAEFGAAIPAILKEAGGPESRLTVGNVELSPNFPHSVAGRAVFSVIGRDIEEARMMALASACKTAIDNAAEMHGLAIDIAQKSWLPPTRLDDDVCTRIMEIAQTAGYSSRVMTSGAGHDAQTFARHVPAGLIFAPSIGGISHSPEELTNWADIEKSASVLTRAMAHFALN
jgi:N-carbamoyl-L-amino-acid hydrolase